MRRNGNSPPPSIAIIGAGFGGIGTAIQLRRAGFTDVTVFERGNRIGGTWNNNTYPGLACDVPSHCYSFSFAPNPDWSRRYSPQPEIRRYLERVAREHGVTPLVRLETEVREARFDEDRGRWVLDTSAGEHEADVVVTACGQLGNPAIPPIPGLADFEGPAFHSGNWDHDVDLADKRVAVIGTGASAIQFVPEIVKEAAHVDVFQRSAPYVMHKADREYPARLNRRWRRHPVAQRLARFAQWLSYESLVPGFGKRRIALKPVELMHRGTLFAQVRDRELRRRLRPTDEVGCKRILVSSDWYPALTLPQVDLITDGVVEITEHSVIAADGTEREADVIIFGTGYSSHDFVAPTEFHGRDGRTLSDAWSEGAQTYMGLAAAGFPNLFFVYGPNTNLGAGSIIFMLESEIHFIVEAVRSLHRAGARTIEVRPEAQAEIQRELQARLAETVWNTGCSSWYVDEHGRNYNNWPGLTVEYRRRTRRLEPAHFALEGEPAGARTGSDPVVAR